MECENIITYSEDQDPEVWIQDIEMQAILKNWTDKQKEIVFYTRITDTVRDWLLNRNLSNWNELKNEFIIKYKPTDSLATCMEELTRTNDRSDISDRTLVDSSPSICNEHSNIMLTDNTEVHRISSSVFSNYSRLRNFINVQSRYANQQYSLAYLYITQAIIVGFRYATLKYWIWKTNYFGNGYISYRSSGETTKYRNEVGQRILCSDMEITKQIFDTTSTFAWIKPSGRLLDVIQHVIAMAIDLNVYKSQRQCKILYQISFCLNVITVDSLRSMLWDLTSSGSASNVSERMNCERAMAINYCVKLIRSLLLTIRSIKNFDTYEYWLIDTSVIRLELCQETLHGIGVCQMILQACKTQGPLQAYHKVFTQTAENPSSNWRLVSGFTFTFGKMHVKILSLLHLLQYMEDDNYANIVHSETVVDSRYYIITGGYHNEILKPEQCSVIINAYGRNTLGHIKNPLHPGSLTLKKAIIRSDTSIPIYHLEIPLFSHTSTIIYDKMVIHCPNVNYRLWMDFRTTLWRDVEDML
ncbi:hypothetical protein BGW37DRAFT_184923 [Umbelopsis sp. PMI_123]|nr:hypothetical protein BGW37DRAFT_184923 [Umbelopsis sp. PMI_123]